MGDFYKRRPAPRWVIYQERFHFAPRLFDKAIQARIPRLHTGFVDYLHNFPFLLSIATRRAGALEGEARRPERIRAA
jgi:hypothetical protein